MVLRTWRKDLGMVQGGGILRTGLVTDIGTVLRMHLGLDPRLALVMPKISLRLAPIKPKTFLGTIRRTPEIGLRMVLITPILDPERAQRIRIFCLG